RARGTAARPGRRGAPRRRPARRGPRRGHRYPAAPADWTVAAVGFAAGGFGPALSMDVLRLALAARLLGDPRPVQRAVGPGARWPARVAGQGPARLHPRGDGGGPWHGPRVPPRRALAGGDAGRGGGGALDPHGPLE